MFGLLYTDLWVESQNQVVEPLTGKDVQADVPVALILGLGSVPDHRIHSSALNLWQCSDMDRML